MLPTEENKLLGKCQGPFKVTKKLGPATYEIASPGGSRSNRTLHITLLKEWFSQKESASVNLIQLVEDKEEIEEQYLSVSQDTSSANLEHLSVEQKNKFMSYVIQNCLRVPQVVPCSFSSEFCFN